MFLPQNVADTKNAFHALKPALQLAKYYQVETVFVPCMCTNFGRMSYSQSLEQMNRAITDDDTSMYSIDKVGDYSVCLVDDYLQQKIINQQPKTYQNTEFGVSTGVYSLLENHKPWVWNSKHV